MNAKEAILALKANAIIACERAGFSSATVRMIEDALDTIKDALKEQPEIVQCKDCIHAEPERVKDEIWCPVTCSLRSVDWFCADGERKEDR